MKATTCVSAIRLTALLAILVMLTGCAPMRKPVIHAYDDSIHNYRYFCISPTGHYTGSEGFITTPYGIFGGTTKSTDPSSVISGILFKNGFVQVHSITPEKAKETMIVNFGETGRRNVNLGYSIEVTIQFVNAETQNLICTCTAEGQGETEADDVRKAIQRALKPLFSSK